MEFALLVYERNICTYVYVVKFLSLLQPVAWKISPYWLQRFNVSSDLNAPMTSRSLNRVYCGNIHMHIYACISIHTCTNTAYTHAYIMQRMVRCICKNKTKNDLHVRSCHLRNLKSIHIICTYIRLWLSNSPLKRLVL
jgi:hypothetical protein